MTRAEAIVAASSSAAEAMELAEAACNGEPDQDWQDGSTTWTMSDGSAVWVCDAEYGAMGIGAADHAMRVKP